ncbi:MAG: YitT family protein [Clostridiales bacterium]|nr:YitT family protein [Clostridiales bacterium]
MRSITSIVNNKIVRQYALIVVGCFLGAMSYPLFLEPNHIAPGGVTGITTILNFYFKLPIGITSLVLNIPLLILGWRIISAGFVFRTIFATALFTVLIDLLRFKPMVMDPLLASIFGGVLLGIGLGLILRGSATTGGTDLLARIVHHRIRAISVGSFLFAFDFVVIVLAWIFLSAEHAMHAIINVFITIKVIDQMLLGFGNDKACYIISQEYEQIEQRIMKEMERGVTRFDTVGAYSGRSGKMLLCVVGRFEVVKIKSIVNEADKKAFMFITDTHETLGEGFAQLIEEDI